MVADGLYTMRGVPVPDYLPARHTAPGPTGVVAGVGGLRLAGTHRVGVPEGGQGL